MHSAERVRRLIQFSRRANFKREKRRKGYLRVGLRFEPKRALYPIAGTALGAAALGGLGAMYGSAAEGRPIGSSIAAAKGFEKGVALGGTLGSIGGLGYLAYKDKKRGKKYSHRLLERGKGVRIR